MTTWQGYHHGENRDERRKGGREERTGEIERDTERERERDTERERDLPLKGVDNVKPTVCR